VHPSYGVFTSVQAAVVQPSYGVARAVQTSLVQPACGVFAAVHALLHPAYGWLVPVQA
jgi:hypothetical protein